jgi:hypothetical protein
MKAFNTINKFLILALLLATSMGVVNAQKSKLPEVGLRNGNNVLDFDGTNDYVVVGNIGAVGDWTIEFWYKSESVTDYKNFFHTSFSGNNGVRMEQYSGGTICFNVSGNNTWNNLLFVITDRKLSSV